MYQCRICKRTFLNFSGLTQHANAAYFGRTSLSRPTQGTQAIQRSDHDANLWSTPITMPVRASQDNIVEMEDVRFEHSPQNEGNDITPENDIVDESESRYNLRNRVQDKLPETIEDIIEETETGLQLLINFRDNDFDPKDL